MKPVLLGLVGNKLTLGLVILMVGKSLKTCNLLNVLPLPRQGTGGFFSELRSASIPLVLPVDLVSLVNEAQTTVCQLNG